MTIILLLAFVVASVWGTAHAIREAVKDGDLAPLIGVGMLWVCVVLTIIAANES